MQKYQIKAPLKGIIRNVPGQFVPEQAFVDGMNVVPKLGYMQKATGFVEYTSQHVEGEILHMTTFQEYNGTRTLVIFTENKIYKWDTAEEQLEDITGNEMTLSYPAIVSSTTFTDWLVFTNGKDPIGRWDGIDNTKQLGGNPPPAKLVRSYFNHLLLANTVEEDNPYPQRIRWSELGNPESWPSEFFLDIMDTPGWIQAIEPIQRQIAVYKEDAIFLLSYAGAPMYFTVNPVVVGQNKGLLAPRAVAQYGHKHYYLGNDDVYVFDGLQSLPIGQDKIDLFTIINPMAQQQSFAFTKDEEIWFVVPTHSDRPDTCYVYNVLQDAWGKRELEGNCINEYFVEETYQIDQMEQPIDSYDIEFDARYFVKNAPDILMGKGNQIFKLESAAGSFNGAPINSWVQTKTFDFGTLRNKRLLSVGFEVESQGDYPLQVWVGTARSPADSIDKWFGPYDFNLEHDYSLTVDLTARAFALRFGTNAADQPWRVQGYWFEYIVVGDR
jgi:hypothetical protein